MDQGDFDLATNILTWRRLILIHRECIMFYLCTCRYSPFFPDTAKSRQRCTFAAPVVDFHVAASMALKDFCMQDPPDDTKLSANGIADPTRQRN